MKFLKFSLIIVVLLSTLSCFEDRDDNGILASDISDFVYKGMRNIYLYKDEIPDLADDRFASDEEYGNYLNSSGSPEALFESLIYDRQNVDRYSWIVDDYIALEQSLSGESISNGLRFYSFAHPNSASQRLLVIRHVINNSTADDLGLQRGQIIDQIDGINLTADNISALLSPNSYTLHFVDYNDNGTPETTDDTVTSNGSTASLNKVAFTENPVDTASIIDVDGENVGYLMYNFFNGDFNSQLNNAFGTFQGSNIQHLVIDLRYNPGGSVNTATLLGSMVTGAFNGEVFAQLIYNSTQQSNNTNFNFTGSFDGNSVNQLNLDKVYVLTTGLSASASELVINSLRPYIEVVQIGGVTEGKSQASITVYDSPDYSRSGANPNHTYAMQPLVAISINKNDEAVPASGIVPNIPLSESAINLGQLGDVNERFLAAAIADIQSAGRIYLPSESQVVPVENETKTSPFRNGMYIDSEFIQSNLKR